MQNVIFGEKAFPAVRKRDGCFLLMMAVLLDAGRLPADRLRIIIPKDFEKTDKRFLEKKTVFFHFMVHILRRERLKWLVLGKILAL